VSVDGGGRTAAPGAFAARGVPRARGALGAGAPPPDPGRRGQPTLRALRGRARLGAGADVSLSPFFERREAYDPAADGVREMVTLPVLWLTLSEGSSVRATYPHVDGEVETASDAVSELVDGRVPTDAAD
jgi:hypothetical protein